MVVILLAIGPTSATPALGQESCPEPNDNFQQACTLEPNSTTRGFLAQPGDVDAYRIEAVDFHARIQLTLAARSMPYRVTLVDWNGQVLASSDPAQQPATVDAVVGPPGTYYAFVDSATGQFDGAVAYLLSARTTYPAGQPPAVLFSTDFRADRPAPTACTGNYGPAAVTCAEEGGRYTIGINEGSTDVDPTTAWLWVGPEVGDFTFTVDARIVRDTTSSGVQINLRDQDYDNGYGIAVVPRDGRAALARAQGGQTTLLSEATRPDLVRSDGVTRITVRAAGDEFRVYLNGQPLLSARDASFKAGHVGFVAFTFDQPFLARFDNVLLTAPGLAP